MNVLVICFGYDASLLQIRGPNYARDIEINPTLDKIRRKKHIINLLLNLSGGGTFLKCVGSIWALPK